MKQIVRQYSMDILKQIADVRQLRWLIPREAREDQVYHFPHMCLLIVTLNVELFSVCVSYHRSYFISC